MIEVEKKFQPTEEQLSKLISDSVFVKEYILNDVYYDYPDYRLIKESTRFRLRNGSFELKIRNIKGGDLEIEDENEIKKYFKTNLKLEEFIIQNLVLLMEYKTERKRYKNGIFNIDIDKMTSEKFKDFSFKICEIEIMVNHEDEIEDAVLKIKVFSSRFGLEKYKMSKKEACLKVMNPNVYKEIFV